MSKVLLALSTTLVFLPLQALAQPATEYGFPITDTPYRDVPCHMVTKNGSTIDLARLCGGTPQVSAASRQAVTLEKFNQVKPGMTLEQVNQIMGFPGTQLTEGSTSRSVTGEIRAVSYGWKNPNGSRVAVVFINDKVNSVREEGLRLPVRSAVQTNYTPTTFSSPSNFSGSSSSNRGGICNNPDDLDKDGNRCGGRASRVRRGGR